MKAIKGHQRPQSKKVKKSHFINHNFLTYTQDAFSSPKKVVKPKILKKVIKGQELKNDPFYQLLEHPCQSDLRGQGNHKNLYNLCRICTIAIYYRSRFHAIFVRIFVFWGHCSLRVYHKSLCRHHGNPCEHLWATSKSKFVRKLCKTPIESRL